MTRSAHLSHRHGAAEATPPPATRPPAPPAPAPSLEALVRRADDIFLAEGYAAASRILGARLPAYCARHTLLLIKPETIAGQRMPALVDWLGAHQWSVVGLRCVRFCRHIVRILWQDNWNPQNRHHLPVMDALLSGNPGVLLVLRDDDIRSVDATRRLAREKGAADPRKRHVDQLRWTLGALNPFLNHVHSPDDAVGFLRELAVLTDPVRWADILMDSVTPMAAAEVLSAVTQQAAFGERWADMTLPGALRRAGLDQDSLRLGQILVASRTTPPDLGRGPMPAHVMEELMSFLRRRADDQATPYSIAVCASYFAAP